MPLVNTNCFPIEADEPNPMQAYAIKGFIEITPEAQMVKNWYDSGGIRAVGEDGSGDVLEVFEELNLVPTGEEIPN